MGEVVIPPIGERIRAERLRRGVSLRALARGAGVSPSLISQIENGRIRPSVSTLYAITGALGASVADLLEGAPDLTDDEGAPDLADDRAETDRLAPLATAGLAAMVALNPVTARRSPRAEPQSDEPGGGRRGHAVVTGPGERETITLGSGVVWEVLGQLPGEQVDFLRITYEPGSASSSGELMRHPGTEYGFLVSGALVAQFDDHEVSLSPGDAVCFRSSTPHRYRNDGAEPAVGIWMVIDD